MSAVQVTKIELESLYSDTNIFQRELHLNTSPQADDDDPSDRPISLFHRDYMKSMWRSIVPSVLDPTIADGGKEDSVTIKYTVNNNFHYLLYTYMCYKLPAVRVKNLFKNIIKIAWCHNVGTNIITDAQFGENDTPYHTMDNIWLDFYFQWYQRGGAGKRDAHNFGIGNIKYLEDFSTSLPSFDIDVDQPWYYSLDPALAFPIFYKSVLNKAEHIYTYKTKIVDLLRCKMYVNDEWIDAPKDADLNKYLIFENSTFKLPAPQLWGRYANVSHDEIDYYKNCVFKDAKDKEGKKIRYRNFYIFDMKSFDAPNTLEYGAIAKSSITSPNPLLALFFGAENEDAKMINNHSNYTTDTQNIYTGWDPIKHSTLFYGGVTRFKDLPSHHSTIAESRHHFPSAPNEAGHHAHSYDWDSTPFACNVGLTFLPDKNASISSLISNGDIKLCYLPDESGVSEAENDLLDSHGNLLSINLKSLTKKTSPKFNYRVRALIMRKFTVLHANNCFTFEII